MKRIIFLLLTMLTVGSVTSTAQEKVIVVVPNHDVKYEDPRFGSEGTLTKGEAISVNDDGSGDYRWWPYPAADVSLSRKDFHIPGMVKGEKYIVINGTNVRFREKPSLQSGILCYNTDSSASYYSIEFVSQSSIQRHYKDADGFPIYWDPYYLPKGTRLPYLGKAGSFFKTSFNGMTLYISSKYSYVR